MSEIKITHFDAVWKKYDFMITDYYDSTETRYKVELIGVISLGEFVTVKDCVNHIQDFTKQSDNKHKVFRKVLKYDDNGYDLSEETRYIGEFP